MKQTNQWWVIIEALLPKIDRFTGCLLLPNLDNEAFKIVINPVFCRVPSSKRAIVQPRFGGQEA